MLLQKGSREDAIHALINTWLKDPALRCGWCGEDYSAETFPCCEQPFIGTNSNIMEQFHNELRVRRDAQNNDYASNKSKTFRSTLSFPPGLLGFLTISFKALYGEELFTDQYNMNWFSRKFYKYFAIPKII
jgi:hypothetical protein